MDLWNEGLVRPIQSSLRLGGRVGGAVLGNVLGTAVEMPGQILRAVDDQQMVAHRQNNRLEDGQNLFIDEIVKHKEDYPLVDISVVNFVLVSVRHSPRMARQGIEETSPYIEEIGEIMAYRGVRKPTVAKAVDNAYDIMPKVVTWDTHGPLWMR